MVLLAGKRSRGAMYLAGFAVECLLKARLMERFDCHTLSELDAELQRRRQLAAGQTVARHKIARLMRLAGLRERLIADRTVVQALAPINDWSTAWRYAPGLRNPVDADDFVESVRMLSGWIHNNI